MDSVSQTPKFVSNIPHNTLEPVFLGVPSGNSDTKGSGKYVPGFLRDKENGTVREKRVVAEPVPENNIINFPSLGTTTSKKPVSVLNFSDAIRKPAIPNNEVQKPKALAHGVKKVEVVKKFSDSDSDDECYPDDEMYYRK